MPIHKEKGAEASFVNRLFWHSLFMTVLIPVSRIIIGGWDYTSGLWIIFEGVTILNKFVLQETEYLEKWKHHENSTQLNTLMTCVPENDNLVFSFRAEHWWRTETWNSEIDFLFWMHAIFGLLWVLTAWVSMYILQDDRALHRKFSVVPIIFFCFHSLAALSNLYHNIAKNSLLPRLFLIRSIIDCVILMVTAIIRVKKKDVQGHKNAMIQCFIYSIEGAGTIRTVKFLQIVFRSGTTFCKNIVNIGYSECLYPYLWMLMLSRFLSLIYLAVWSCMYTGLRKKQRSKAVWLEFLLQFCAFTFCYDPARIAALDNEIEVRPFIAIPLFLLCSTILRICLL